MQLASVENLLLYMSCFIRLTIAFRSNASKNYDKDPGKHHYVLNRVPVHTFLSRFPVYHMKSTGFEVISEEDSVDLYYKYNKLN
jgi:hypothetical protein